MKNRIVLIIVFLIIGIVAILDSCDYNACVESNCQNGAFCVNGECQCQYGYEGENCEIQIFASTLIIDSVELQAIPNPPGLSWDPEYDTSDVNSNPDVYMEIWTSKRDTNYLGEISHTEIEQLYDGKTVNLVSNLDESQLIYNFPVDSMLTGIKTSYSIKIGFYEDDGATSTTWGEIEEQFISTASEQVSGIRLYQIAGLTFKVFYTVIP